MFASKIRSISVATAESKLSPDLPPFSPKATSLPLQENAPLISMNYTSNKRGPRVLVWLQNVDSR